jgi:probable HAF family extracellular repeat protein
MVGRRRWRAAAAVALVMVTAGVAASESAAATPGSEQPTIAVTRLIGPDGQAMASADHINERGLVTGTVPGTNTSYNPPRLVVWQRGAASYLAPGLPGHTVLDVSDRGQVVGNINGLLTFGGFSWSDGVYAVLPPAVNADPENPRPVMSSANAVNERGQVLGLHTDWAGETPVVEMVVWEDGEVTAIADRLADPADINDRGQAAVNERVSTPDDGTSVAAVWRVGGAITPLGTLGGRQSRAQAIDRWGRVAGTSETASGDEHAFLWRGGRMIDLGTLGGTTSSVGERLVLGTYSDQADAFNDRGEVAGTSETASGDEHAFLWRGGRMMDLGTLGGATSHATALNNRGQVVGYSETATGERHAFLWQGGEMIDLGALAGGGWSQANDINDRGQIVGSGGGSAVVWTAPPRR